MQTLWITVFCYKIFWVSCLFKNARFRCVLLQWLLEGGEVKDDPNYTTDMDVHSLQCPCRNHCRIDGPRCHVLIREALQSLTIPIPTVQCCSCFLSTHNAALFRPPVMCIVFLGRTKFVFIFCCYGGWIATDRGTIRSSCAGNFIRARFFVFFLI